MSTFTIPGTPIPKQRPRRNAKGVWYTPFRTLVYEKKVCLYAKVGRVRRTAAPLRVAIALFLPDRGGQASSLGWPPIQALLPEVISDESRGPLEPPDAIDPNLRDYLRNLQDQVTELKEKINNG